MLLSDILVFLSIEIGINIVSITTDFSLFYVYCEISLVFLIVSNVILFFLNIC